MEIYDLPSQSDVQETARTWQLLSKVQGGVVETSSLWPVGQNTGNNLNSQLAS